MSEPFDVAVVGAGPAGLAATVAAAEAGLRVVTVDAGPQPGGQFWRHPDERVAVADPGRGQHDWSTYVALRRRFEAARAAGLVTYLPSTRVWFVDGVRTLRLTSALDGGYAGPSSVTARALVLCPGGYDRQLPIPGWDLPGVMAAGGVQALLKAHRTLAGRRAIVAGTGPFLLPVATALAEAGARVMAVCEAGDLTGWVRNAVGAAQAPSKGLEGFGYAFAMARHRIPYRIRTAVTAIRGADAVRTVTTSRLARDGRLLPGTERTIEVDLVALGWGFTPSLELVLAVGADTRLDVDGSLVAVVDAEQRSTIPGVYVAGEATGVGGALLAVAEGELAGLTAASDLGTWVGRRLGARRLRGGIRRGRAFARAMHRAHPIPERWSEWLTPDTIVCRCEEVSFDDLRRARDLLGATDARGAKSLSRAGMGWCQGRICGSACALLAAEGRPLRADDLRPVEKRSLAAPIRLADLAALEAPPSE
jgi:NADP-dependent aldehyde dehydrogenase